MLALMLRLMRVLLWVTTASTPTLLLLPPKVILPLLRGASILPPLLLLWPGASILPLLLLLRPGASNPPPCATALKTPTNGEGVRICQRCCNR